MIKEEILKKLMAIKRELTLLIEYKQELIEEIGSRQYQKEIDQRLEQLNYYKKLLKSSFNEED